MDKCIAKNINCIEWFSYILLVNTLISIITLCIYKEFISLIILFCFCGLLCVVYPMYLRYIVYIKPYLTLQNGVIVIQPRPINNEVIIDYEHNNFMNIV